MSWKKIEDSKSGADVWDFSAQPELEGEFLRKEEKVGPNNSNMYHFLVGADDKAEEVAVWGNTVLDGKLAEVQTGQKVRIKFLGKAVSKRGNTFKNFEVDVWEEELPF